MAVNKVVTSGGTTLLDLTGDTVTSAAHIMSGFIGHLADGTQVTGTGSGGGGATNFVMGTFTGTTTGAAMTVPLGYTGSGYPIAVVIAPAVGSYNSSEGTFYSTVQRYAVCTWFGVKGKITTAPAYSAGSNDKMTCMGIYKSSTTSYTSFSQAFNKDNSVFTSSAASAGNAYSVVKINSATAMSVFIASSSYGFMANVEYVYMVVYSS